MNLYRKIPIRFRIAIGLVGLMTGTILIACALGLFPNKQQMIRDGRSKLCEALAISGTAMVSDGKFDSLRVTLESIVHRDPDVVSIGFRSSEDELLVAAGKHEEGWIPYSSNTEQQMQVPVFRHDEHWGNLEIVFTPTNGWLSSWGPAALLLFTVPICIFQFSIFLKKTLDSLDPDGAMPAKVRDVLDTFSEGLVLIDIKDRILFANKRFTELVGIESGTLVGMKSAKLPWILPEESRNELPWNEARRLDSFVSDRTVMFMRDDRKLTMQVNSTPTIGNGMMATFDDITLIEENKAKLAVALGAARDASEAKSSFLANMSHEIRTPLNAVLGFTDVLRRGLVTDSNEAVDHLNMIHRSGAHLLELINDILDLSKIEAGKMQVESIDTPVDSIILDTIDVLAVRANEKGIEISTEFATPVPRVIQADPTRLRQIITNLVGNAIKFTEKGSVKIVAELVQDSCPELQIHIVDSGVGMTEQQQEKIFDSFVQADSTTTRKFGGTGLGLSISRRLAEAMGGSLRVKSEANVGSTFTICLPLNEVADEDLITPKEIQQQSSRRLAARNNSSLLRLPNKPILVVDDGEANRQLIELVLSRAGAQVDTAVNGLEAIKALSEKDYAIVFMDMQMPVLDGYTATKRIRECGSKTPIVALTGNAMKGDREKCMAAGCDDFLSKPVNLDALLRCSVNFIGPGEEAPDTTDTPANSPALAKAFPSDGQKNVNDDTAIHSLLPMDDDDFRSVVSDFIDRLDDRLDFIESSCQQADFETVRSEAHWLKGSGGTVGLPILGAPAAQLEEAAKEGDIELATKILAEIREIRSRIVNPVVGDGGFRAVDSAREAVHAEPDNSTGPIHTSLPIDDEEFLSIVIDFVARLDQRLEKMHQLFADRKYEELGNEAHWLKGAGGTVGYGALMSPAMQLLQAARGEVEADCEAGLQRIRMIRSRMVVPESSPIP